MKRKTINQIVCSALVAVTLGLASWQCADACSRILWNDNKLVVVVGRTILDKAATVNEALALLDKLQIVMTEARGEKTSVHLAIEDASGDSAIIEYIGGKQVVHHGREFRIMTNDPIYNVSVPFGAPYKGFGIYNTEYRTVIDLTSKRYFFEAKDV